MIVILMIIKTKAVAHRCSVKKVFLEMPRAFNLIKKEPLAQVFSCEFCEISKNTFSYEHLWWLLLMKIIISSSYRRVLVSQILLLKLISNFAVYRHCSGIPLICRRCMFSKTMCAIFPIFCRSSFVNDFMVRSNFSEP